MNVDDDYMILIKNGHKYLVQVFSDEGTRAFMPLLFWTCFIYI